jgi:hypothetical protein
MANELTLQFSMSFSKTGSASLDKRSGNASVTVTGTDVIMATQSIGTSAEDIALGDITTSGYMFVHNLDGTNYVEIGKDDTGTFEAVVKLKAGEYGLFRLATTAPQAKANSGACLIEYAIIED